MKNERTKMLLLLEDLAVSKAAGRRVAQRERPRKRTALKVEGQCCAKIDLGNGRFAIVDTSVADVINTYRWRAVAGKSGWRAQRSFYFYGRKVRLSMHRIVMGLPAKWCDHVNGNPLDNRRSNLRTANGVQNRANARPFGKISNYKGVLKDKRLWAARIETDGRARRLGLFKTEFEAARAYDVASLTLRGDFARLNLKPDRYRSGRYYSICPTCNGGGCAKCNSEGTVIK